MATPGPTPDRIREAWQVASAGDVVRALRELDEYNPDVATIIREEAERRALSADSAEALPPPTYEPLRRIAGPAGSETLGIVRRVGRTLRRHPFCTAALCGLLLPLIGQVWIPQFLLIPPYLIALGWICRPLRSYRDALLAPLLAGAMATAIMLVLLFRFLHGLPPPLGFTPLQIFVSMLLNLFLTGVAPALMLLAIVFIRNRYWPLPIPGHCRVCRYNLHGLSEPRCPECGTPFDPEELAMETSGLGGA